MHIPKFYGLLAVVLFSFSLMAQDFEPRPLVIDQEHMWLNVKPIPEKKRVEGEVKIAFRAFDKPVDSIWLDGIDMKVKRLQMNGRRVKHKVYPNGISVKLKKPLLAREADTIQVKYVCHPRKGIFFVGYDDPSLTVPRQIWTQGQGVDHRYWIPHVDAQNDKMTYSISIDAEQGKTVISNGIFIDSLSQKGRTIHRFEMRKPMSSYLLMLTIGDYIVQHDTAESGIPLENYMYPDCESCFDFTYWKNRELFNWFEDFFGPYPWNKYAQVPVRDFLYGAMENTTATIFGDFYINDNYSFNDRPYFSTNAHELAHQWFGNLVTSTCAKHHWIHESFATYLEWMAVREFQGEDAFRERFFQGYMEAFLDYIFTEDVKPLAHPKAGTTAVYHRGPRIFYMLEKQLGEDFWKGVRTMLNERAYGLVETEDMKKYWEEASGRDLTHFFDTWFYGNGMPLVDIDRVPDTTGGNLKFVLTQTVQRDEKNTAYPMTLDWEVISKSGHSIKGSFYLDKELDTLAFPLPKDSISYWVFDPDGALMAFIRESNVEKQMPLRAKHPTIPARASAFELMKNDNPSLWEEALLNDSSVFVRKAAMRAYLKYAARNGNTRPLELALNQPIEVQKVLGEMQLEIPEEWEPYLRQFLMLPSYKNAQNMMVILGGRFPNNVPEYLEILKQDTRLYQKTAPERYRAEYMATYSKESLDSLLARTAPRYDFLERRRAFEFLAELNICHPEAYEAALESVDYFNGNLRREARRYLQEALDENACGQEFKDYIKKRRKKLRKPVRNWVETVLLSDET